MTRDECERIADRWADCAEAVSKIAARPDMTDAERAALVAAQRAVASVALNWWRQGEALPGRALVSE